MVLYYFPSQKVLLLLIHWNTVCFFPEKWSTFVAPAVLELAIHLPQPPECWDSNYVPPEPVSGTSYH